MNPDAERYLRQTILPDLDKGRPLWDRPHTEAVVRYAKAIIAAEPGLNLDPDVLIIAAYTHDWGYANLFEGGQPVDYRQIKGMKKLHMEIGATKTTELLRDRRFDYLSAAQKRRAVHLVAVHDKLSRLKATDELVLMEADTLGAFDAGAVTPTFSAQDNQKWLREANKKRVTGFITPYAKHMIEELRLRRQHYFDRTTPAG